jgi:pyruvate/2-oxoglutarate/acetoin dehydrogenase E1 component
MSIAPTDMSKKSYRQALNEALRQEMRRDSRVIVAGVDVASGQTSAPSVALQENKSAGGVLGVTNGLFEEFGPNRVIETPITESALIGMCTGAACTGLRPVADLVFIDFIGVCFDQIFNQAAKLRYMFGGQVKVPLVIRANVGGGVSAGAQHSQMLHPILTHIPGLKVALPSGAYDAKGLLIEAIRDEDPVLLLEHKALYDSQEDVPDDPYRIPFGEANVIMDGEDVTVVAFSNMVHKARNVAERLRREGCSVELIDPRTTSPLDEDTIIDSVERTGRLVIVDEGYPRCGIAADIGALVASRALSALKAPIVCVTPPHSPVPFAPQLEESFIPSEERIAGGIRQAIRA